MSKQLRKLPYGRHRLTEDEKAAIIAYIRDNGFPPAAVQALSRAGMVPEAIDARRRALLATGVSSNQTLVELFGDRTRAKVVRTHIKLLRRFAKVAPAAVR